MKAAQKRMGGLSGARLSRSKDRSHNPSGVCQRLVVACLAVAALAVCGCGGSSAPGPVYFLVAEVVPQHGDSFLLPLTAPDDIARARELAASPHPQPPTIVVAQIASGNSDGQLVNRDLLHGGKPWSWHVSRFLNFADMTIEIMDGWPGYVEDNFAAWQRNTGGDIGFWQYTVRREVSAEELRGPD